MREWKSRKEKETESYKGENWRRREGEGAWDDVVL